MLIYLYDVSCWYVNFEYCAFPLFTFCSNDTVVILYNFLYYGEAYTSAWIVFFIMEPLKDFKNLFTILLFKTDAVVFYFDAAIFFMTRQTNIIYFVVFYFMTFNSNYRGCIWLCKFERVTYQV